MNGPHLPLPLPLASPTHRVISMAEREREKSHAPHSHAPPLRIHQPWACAHTHTQKGPQPANQSVAFAPRKPSGGVDSGAEIDTPEFSRNPFTHNIALQCARPTPTPSPSSSPPTHTPRNPSPPLPLSPPRIPENFFLFFFFSPLLLLLNSKHLIEQLGSSRVG